MRSEAVSRMKWPLFNAKSKQKRKSLDNAFQQAQDKLRNVALEIVGEIAKEQKLDLVVTEIMFWFSETNLI